MYMALSDCFINEWEFYEYIISTKQHIAMYSLNRISLVKLTQGLQANIDKDRKQNVSYYITIYIYLSNIASQK